VWLVLAKLASPRAQKSWMPVMTLILILPSQLCAFQALPLPLLSHLSFPSILVVGPHKSLISPGPIYFNLITLSNFGTGGASTCFRRASNTASRVGMSQCANLCDSCPSYPGCRGGASSLDCRQTEGLAAVVLLPEGLGLEICWFLADQAAAAAAAARSPAA